MSQQKTLNIYLEQIISNQDKKMIWDKILYSKEFQSLFTEKKSEFQEGNTGTLFWRNFFIFPVHGFYEIEFYQEYLNILVKINANKFSSLLLITLEENRDGVLLRIDHRSFFGANNKKYHYQFVQRWKKLLKSFITK